MVREKEMKRELPEDIKRDMRLWREGFTAMPKSYIAFHQELAMAGLKELEDKGIEIHRTYMNDDGWLDGMNVLHVIAELVDDTLVKLKWSDSNQGWMKKCPSGGWASFN